MQVAIDAARRQPRHFIHMRAQHLQPRIARQQLRNQDHGQQHRGDGGGAEHRRAETELQAFAGGSWSPGTQKPCT